MITEKDMHGLIRLYTAKDLPFESMGVSHNAVYKIPDEKPFILRVTSDGHRTKEELLSEIDFLLFLAEQGIDVGLPIPSLSGEYVTDRIIDGQLQHITAFHFVDGLHWMQRSDDQKRLQHIGRALGRLHRCAKGYIPSPGIKPRRTYHQSQHLIKGHTLLPEYDPRLYRCFTAFLGKLSALPKSTDTYGLTHGDFLFSNYHITEDNRVLLFDFDECEYNRYVSDIAVCIYYYLLGGDPSELDGKTEEAERSLLSLTTGYLQENRLPPEELRHIDLFFQMRDYILISTIIGRGAKEIGQWDRAVLDGAQVRVTENRPFAGIDIEKVMRILYGL